MKTLRASFFFGSMGAQTAKQLLKKRLFPSRISSLKYEYGA
jgi:hypothetical protein